MSRTNRCIFEHPLAVNRSESNPNSKVFAQVGSDRCPLVLSSWRSSRQKFRQTVPLSQHQTSDKKYLFVSQKMAHNHEQTANDEPRRVLSSSGASWFLKGNLGRARSEARPSRRRPAAQTRLATSSPIWRHPIVFSRARSAVRSPSSSTRFTARSSASAASGRPRS